MARALLLCILLCSCCSASTGRVEDEGDPRHAASVAQQVIPSSSRAFLPLAHRRAPKPSLAERFRRDGARRSTHILGRSSMRMRSSSNSGAPVVIPTELGYSVGSLEYVVTVGFGTPAVPQTVMIDSGSDFTWIQCTPCGGSGECYPQTDRLFDPRESASYAPVPCDSGACRNISTGVGDGCTTEQDSRCAFSLTYANGSNSTGVYGSDKLTLAPGVVVEGFRFGCGHDQQGMATDDGTFDGVIGLGITPESLVSQASPDYGGAFSYCLPGTSASTGFLALGRPAATTTPGFVFTPMHPSDHVAVFYKVTLTAISVAGRPLDVAPSAFPHGDYGMMLDSGTVVTLLPATPYAALRAAFRRAMAAYPRAPPVHPVDTCYNLTGYSNVTVPSVALTFLGGATVELDNPSGVLVEGCLAFAGLKPDDHGNGVIGNVNQRTMEVLYDPEYGTVGLRAAAC